jgi:hypothetical protein
MNQYTEEEKIQLLKEFTAMSNKSMCKDERRTNAECSGYCHDGRRVNQPSQRVISSHSRRKDLVRKFFIILSLVFARFSGIKAQKCAVMFGVYDT